MGSKGARGDGADHRVIREPETTAPPKTEGRVSGSSLRGIRKSQLGAGESYVGLGGNTNAQRNDARKAYDVEVSDGRIKLTGAKGSQTIDAPGLKGRAKGKITTETVELFDLASNGEYKVELEDDTLRFRREDGGRVRERFSVKLLQDSGPDAASAKRARANRADAEARVRRREENAKAIEDARRDIIKLREQAKEERERESYTGARLRTEGGARWERENRDARMKRIGYEMELQRKESYVARYA